MVKVELAFWYKGKSPGDVVEVDDAEYAVMKRDGRAARVVKDEKPKSASPENKKAPADNK